MIAIIGGGISGLAAAIELQKWCEPCVVLDAGDSPGGVIQTERIDGYQLEYGANSILTDQEVTEFLIKTGLENEFYPAGKSSKKRYIFRNGRYHRLPTKPYGLLTTSFLSWPAKLAILKEWYKKPEVSRPDETLGEFIERRFNREIADYILAPFITGIYAGDPYQLLLKETFPVLACYEEEYGSVLKGFIKNKGGERKQGLYFKSGMQALPDAMAAAVKRLERGAVVQRITKHTNNYEIHYMQNGEQRTLECDTVVLSAPAYVSADIIGEVSHKAASAFRNINYAPVVKVFLGYDRKKVRYPFNGFGALNPPVENQYMLGSIWNTSTFPLAAPRGKVLLTCMAGGMIQSNRTQMKDDYILHRVKADIASYFKIKAEPEFTHVYRLDRAIPQNDSAINAVRDILPELENSGIYISANWLGGPALSDCIRKGRQIALKITEARSGMDSSYKGCC